MTSANRASSGRLFATWREGAPDFSGKAAGGDQCHSDCRAVKLGKACPKVKAFGAVPPI